MYVELLNVLCQSLERQATHRLKTRFALTQQQAEYIVPVVASLVLVRFRSRLAQADTAEALRESFVCLTQNQPVDADGRQRMQNALQLGQNLLGDRLSVAGRALGTALGLDQATSLRVIDCVLPPIVEVLGRLLLTQGIDATRTMLDVRPGTRRRRAS